MKLFMFVTIQILMKKSSEILYSLRKFYTTIANFGFLYYQNLSRKGKYVFYHQLLSYRNDFVVTKLNDPEITPMKSLLSSSIIQNEMLPALKDFDHLSDINFVVDDKTYKLHKCILMSRSKWFEALLSHNFNENNNVSCYFSKFSKIKK